MREGTGMTVFVGADHRGVRLKSEIVQLLEKLGHAIVDVGAYSEEKPCDYPLIAFEVAKHVSKTRGSRGILVCMSGVGLSIAANKVPGAYAALCYNKESAKMSREHNNANILVLGAEFVSKAQLQEIVEVWLTTKFEGGRHLRRFKKIQMIERTMMKNDF